MISHRVVLAFLIVLTGTCATTIFANPVFDVQGWLNQLPRRVVENPSESNDKAFVRAIGLGGLDDMQVSTLEYMDDHFGRFKKLMVRSQRPPYGVSLPLQNWYRSRAKEADREAMIESLRLWIAVPLDLPRLEPWLGQDSLQNPMQYSVQAAQGRAAEALVDWGDRESLPAMERLPRQFRENGSQWSASYVPAEGVKRAIQRLRSRQ